jgi:hypothetical protein
MLNGAPYVLRFVKSLKRAYFVKRTILQIPKSWVKFRGSGMVWSRGSSDWDVLLERVYVPFTDVLNKNAAGLD